MLQGPSAGPAMVLNILMRWPPLIVLCAVAGSGAVFYDQVDADKAITSFKALAVEAGLMKVDKVVEAAKKVDLIPTAIAAQVQPPLMALQAITPEVTFAPIAEPAKPMTVADLRRLELIQLNSSRIARVVVAAE